MLTALLPLLLQTAAAPMTAPATPCVAQVPPPAGLEAWNAAPAASNGPVSIGTAAALTLAPSSQTTFVATPDRAPMTGSFSGIYTLTVAKAGTYRVALSAGAWIDLLDARRQALKSVAHTEGPACSGIRKIVDFALTPGKYTLQLSGAKPPAMRVLVAAK